MEIPTDHLHKMTIEEFDTSKLLINAARQRDQRNLQDTLVVDVDTSHWHHGAATAQGTLKGDDGEAEGCGCDASDSGGDLGSGLFLVLLLGLTRRRRR